MKGIQWLGHFPSFSEPEVALMDFHHLVAGEGGLIPAESCKNLPPAPPYPPPSSYKPMYSICTY